MPFEEWKAEPGHMPPVFTLGQLVVDREGRKLGKVQARFSRYLLIERGGLFGKAYYVPHTDITGQENGTLRLAVTEKDLKRLERDRLPEDLYADLPEHGPSDITGVAMFARGPLSPAETGHYNYGPRWPGINTDASGSYHRDEVVPDPRKVVKQEIFTTDLPIESREISSN